MCSSANIILNCVGPVRIFLLILLHVQFSSHLNNLLLIILLPIILFFSYEYMKIIYENFGVKNYSKEDNAV